MVFLCVLIFCPDDIPPWGIEGVGGGFVIGIGDIIFNQSESFTKEPVCEIVYRIF
jgi:hypothetical protein